MKIVSRDVGKRKSRETWRLFKHSLFINMLKYVNFRMYKWQSSVCMTVCTRTRAISLAHACVRMNGSVHIGYYIYYMVLQA